MPSNDQRFPFLDQFKLSVTYDDGFSIYWRGKPSPGQPGGYHAVSEGASLEEAADAANR